MSTVCSPNTLGGKPLVIGSASTCLLLICSILLIWFRTFSFTTYNLMSMCLAAHLNRCHRSKMLKWLLPLSTIINSGYRFSEPFCLSLSLVSSYNISLHHIDDNCFILWSFSTQKLQVWKLATIVDFAIHFTSLVFVLTIFLEHLFLSAWGRYLWLHSSDLYMDWTLPKQPG